MIEAPYHNIGTFLKSSSSVGDRTRACVIGLPWDGSSSFRTGQRMAPAAVRAASAMLTDGDHPAYLLNPVSRIADLGDLPLGNEYAGMIKGITDFYVGNKLPLFAIGGDHSVTLGALTGLANKNIENLRLLVFDSHPDTWATAFSEKRGHGTFVRNAIEDEIVKPQNVLQVGLRSPVDRETMCWMRGKGGINSFSTFDIGNNYNRVWSCIRGFSSGFPLYVSVDIDVLDPAYAPGTGTPEIGGISSRMLLSLLEAVDCGQLVGADVVEVLPAYDNPSGITSLAAATVLWTLLCSYLSPPLHKIQSAFKTK